MNVIYRIDKDILYINVEGRVDASNANLVEQKIFDITNINKEKRNELPYYHSPRSSNVY